MVNLHSGGDVDNERGYVHAGQEVSENSLYHSLNFSMNLKLL
jgi:hypothetical protein